MGVHCLCSRRLDEGALFTVWIVSVYLYIFGGSCSVVSSESGGREGIDGGVRRGPGPLCDGEGSRGLTVHRYLRFQLLHTSTHIVIEYALSKQSTVCMGTFCSVQSVVVGLWYYSCVSFSVPLSVPSRPPGTVSVAPLHPQVLISHTHTHAYMDACSHLLWTSAPETQQDVISESDCLHAAQLAQSLLSFLPAQTGPGMLY